jgi:hypothetical protein
MTKPPTLFKVLFVAAFTIGLAACGGNMMANMSSRQLQSIAITPATASGTNGGAGVQFTATGMYNMAPMTVMSPPVLWSIGGAFTTAPMPAGVSVDANGMARCTGFVGTIMIAATAPMDPNMPLSKMSMMTSNVAGTAQFTCM